MSGLIELFELLEIKSELWENKTEKKEKMAPDGEATKSGATSGGGGGGSSAGDKDAWSPETAGTDKTDVEDNSCLLYTSRCV